MADYRSAGDGDAIAAVRPGAVLFLGGADAASIAARLWGRLSADATTGVLEALTANGLGRTPEFALVTWASGAEVRVVVRGGFDVTVGGELVSGAGVSSWSERVLGAGDAGVALAVRGGAAGERLPIVEGVVRASAIELTTAELAPAGAAGRAPATAPVPEISDVSSAPEADAPVAPAPVADDAPVPPAPAAFAPAPTPPPAPVPFVPPAAAATPAVSAPAAPVAPAVVAEHTIVPPDDTAAPETSLVTPPAAAPPAPTPAADALGDHDGLTVADVDIRKLRAERAAAPAPASAADERDRPAEPSALIRLPGGARERLQHEIIVGRAPSVSKVSGDRVPKLVTVGAGDPDISRNHVRFALEGDTVVVTDLHSRNGTHVVQPGKAPVRLRSGEATPVLIGTVVDLGGGITIQVVDG